MEKEQQTIMVYEAIAEIESAINQIESARIKIKELSAANNLAAINSRAHILYGLDHIKQGVSELRQDIVYRKY